MLTCASTLQKVIQVIFSKDWRGGCADLNLHKLHRMDSFKKHPDPFLGMLGSRGCNLLCIDLDAPKICVLGLRG